MTNRYMPFRRALLSFVAILWITAAAALSAAEIRSAPSVPAVKLDAAVDAAAELPRLQSLLVSWQGDLILERYFNGTNASRMANIKSASKSVISALVGIAIDRGLIDSVNQPISSFFPELLAGNGDSPKREITIEDLLTMRSGLESTSNRNYGAWVQSSNWVRYALNRPLLRTPGTIMQYSTGNTHLLSAILTKVTGTSTWDFAQQSVAKPMGFSLARWTQDPQGIYFGGNNMLMTPRQMLAFGELYLNRGQSNSKQIIPARWVDASLIPRTESHREQGRFYGYGWWVRDLAGQQTFYAWGFGGQFIFLVPELDLVIVTTSSDTVTPERHGHRRTVYDIVEHFIISPIAAARSAQ